MSAFLPIQCAAAAAAPTDALLGWHCEAVAGRPDGNFWLRPATLHWLSEHPQGATTYAVRLRHPATGREVYLTVQRFDFRSNRQVSAEAGGGETRFDLRRRLLARLSFRVLVLGQLLTSGDYGVHGLDALTDRECATLLPAVAEHLAARENCRVSAILLKDVLPTCPPGHTRKTSRQAINELTANGFCPLPAEPVMELSVNPEWQSIDDYLSALSSKYRVRYRRARKQFAGLQRRELTAAETRARLDRIWELYRNVSGSVGFNLADLTPAYFDWLAERADFTGYFDGDSLIGFTTAIPNGDVLHAHFLGMEGAYKHTHHLYHNMLLDLLQRAIAGRYTLLDYGRTATEIKSSVGAEAREYPVLLRARNPLLNWLIPRFVPAVFHPVEWRARNPWRGK